MSDKLKQKIEAFKTQLDSKYTAYQNATGPVKEAIGEKLSGTMEALRDALDGTSTRDYGEKEMKSVDIGGSKFVIDPTPKDNAVKSNSSKNKL